MFEIGTSSRYKERFATRVSDTKRELEKMKTNVKLRNTSQTLSGERDETETEKTHRERHLEEREEMRDWRATNKKN